MNDQTKKEVSDILLGLIHYENYEISANGEVEPWAVDDLIEYIDDRVWGMITSEDGSLSVSVPRLMEILTYQNDFYFSYYSR